MATYIVVCALISTLKCTFACHFWLNGLHAVQEDLDRLSEWVQIWQFNVSKCVVMRCTRSQSPSTHVLYITHNHTHTHVHALSANRQMQFVFILFTLCFFLLQFYILTIYYSKKLYRNPLKTSMHVRYCVTIVMF